MALSPRRVRLLLYFLVAISGCLTVSAKTMDWAIEDPNNHLAFYAIRGDTYYKVNLNGQRLGTGQVSDLFPGLPSGIQAATWWPGKEKYHFFKDGKYYTSDSFGGSVSGPFEGSSLGDLFTNPIEAASSYSGNTYFYRRSHLYEFERDQYKRVVYAGSYGVTGTMYAGATVRGQLLFFGEQVTWIVYPYTFGLMLGSMPIKMADYL